MPRRREKKVGDLLLLATSADFLDIPVSIKHFCLSADTSASHSALLCPLPVFLSLAWVKAKELLPWKNCAIILQLRKLSSSFVLLFSEEVPKRNSAPMHCRIFPFYFLQPYLQPRINRIFYFPASNIVQWWLGCRMATCSMQNYLSPEIMKFLLVAQTIVFFMIFYHNTMLKLLISSCMYDSMTLLPWNCQTSFTCLMSTV